MVVDKRAEEVRAERRVQKMGVVADKRAEGKVFRRWMLWLMRNLERSFNYTQASMTSL